jgi:hypothetical protein
MNRLVKSAIAGALALGAASGANALGLPGSNSSDLILVIENPSTEAFFAVDTGITLSSLLPSASLSTSAVLQSLSTLTTQTLNNSSSSLDSFLATNPVSGDQWTLEGAQYAGGGKHGTTASTNGDVVPQSGTLIAFTSLYGTSNGSLVSNAQTANLVGIDNGLNGELSTVAGNGEMAALLTSTAVTGGIFSTFVASGNPEQTKWGLFGADDLGPTGSSNPLKIFGLTGANVNGQAESYVLGSAALSISGSAGAYQRWWDRSDSGRGVALRLWRPRSLWRPAPQDDCRSLN